MQINPIFRIMQVTDLPVILAIEQEQPFPWTAGMLRDCLTAGYANWVVEDQNEIVGFAVLAIAGDKADILNIAIKASCQRCGYGRQLLQHLLIVARQQQVKQVLLEVRVSNIAAIKLYQISGFNIMTIRKNYYPAPEGREDALVLFCNI